MGLRLCLHCTSYSGTVVLLHLWHCKVLCVDPLLAGESSPTNKIKPPPMRGDSFVGEKVSPSHKALSTPALFVGETFVGQGCGFFYTALTDKRFTDKSAV